MLPSACKTLISVVLELLGMWLVEDLNTRSNRFHLASGSSERTKGSPTWRSGCVQASGRCPRSGAPEQERILVLSRAVQGAKKRLFLEVAWQ